VKSKTESDVISMWPAIRQA